MVNQPLQANCDVFTQPSLANARADITWRAPNGSVVANQVVPFMLRNNADGTQSNVASLPLNFPQFTPDNFGEYTCLAIITSDDLPGARTGVLRTVEIPSSSKSHIYPSCPHVVAVINFIISVYRSVMILDATVTAVLFPP